MTIPPHLSPYISNSDLFTQSMTHRSFVNENASATSNERLEFLGDAILEFVISDMIYHQFPTEPEGILTAVRAYLVQTQSLSAIALQLDLGKYLLLARGEELAGGRDNPSLLENAFEALIGAVFLDKGLPLADKLVKDLLTSKMQELNLETLKDPKGQLQEYVQAQGLSTPVYKVTNEVGPDHNKEFTVAVIVGDRQLAIGVGKSKQQAQQQAATAAISQTRQNH